MEIRGSAQRHGIGPARDGKLLEVVILHPWSKNQLPSTP